MIPLNSPLYEERYFSGRLKACARAYHHMQDRSPLVVSQEDFFVLLLRFGWRKTSHSDMTGQDLRCDALQQAGSWSQCTAISS